MNLLIYFQRLTPHRCSAGVNKTAMTVLKGETDITSEYAASAFVWTRDTGNATADATWNAAHNGVKQFTMNAADLTENVKLTCTLTGTSPDYGAVYVDEHMNLGHAPAEADANDTLHLENCILSVETPNNEYHLVGNVLSVIRHRLNGSVTAEAWVYTAAPEKLVEFEYNSAGLRVQKKVTDHGQTVTTSYIYNGKKLVELTCGEDTLHFFYGMQARPLNIRYNGEMYIYIYDLQGSVMSIRDSNGESVVNYVYDAWGRLIGNMAADGDIVEGLNPFRYRGYVYDDDTEMYCLQERYYLPENARFIGQDSLIQCYRLHGSNGMLYCWNAPPQFSDDSGMRPSPSVTPSPSRPKNWDAPAKREEEFRAKVLRARALWQRIADSYEKWRLQKYVRYTDGRDANGNGSIHIQVANERYLQDYDLDIIENHSIDILVDLIDRDLSDMYGIELTDAGRDQLWGELRGHIWAYDHNLKRDSCAIIDIDVFSDGSVKDSRGVMNGVFWLFGKTKA